MSYWIGLPLLVLAALTEVSVLPMFRLYGLQPNLVLVMLIAWLIVRGSGEAFILAPIGGVLLGFVDGAPVGTALIGLAPLAFLQDLRGSQLREGGLIAAIAFTIVMSLFYNFVHLGVFTILGEAGEWGAASLRIIVPTVFLNVAILLPAYWLLTLARPEERRTVYI
ncbi:MAG TPA: rod shape-determining protein MreD [Dehalococcoidia bacterium]|nr:rod shape-determining protein MreD [Dehalococcoidia bacterium]